MRMKRRAGENVARKIMSTFGYGGGKMARGLRRGRVKKLLLITGLTAVVIMIGARLFSESRQNTAIEEEIARLELEADKIEEKNGELASLVERMTDTDFAEREARLKLGLRRPGEQVIVIEPETDKSAEAQPQSEELVGNPERWWYYFFERDRLAALAIKP